MPDTTRRKATPRANSKPISRPNTARRSTRGRRADAEARRFWHSHSTIGAVRHKSSFSRIADWAAHATGSPIGFILAFGVVAAWAISGPLFGFSDTWQLVINTGTTVVTFLMVFLVQATQNRDSVAIHLKLDELVRAIGAADNELLDMEELSPKELEQIRDEYEKLAKAARNGKR